MLLGERQESELPCCVAHDLTVCLNDASGAARLARVANYLLDDLDIEPGVAPDAPVHHGGPVEPARGFVLHSDDYRRDDATLAVTPGIGLIPEFALTIKHEGQK